jgi:hypothetical protein
VATWQWQPASDNPFSEPPWKLFAAPASELRLASLRGSCLPRSRTTSTISSGNEKVTPPLVGAIVKLPLFTLTAYATVSDGTFTPSADCGNENRRQKRTCSLQQAFGLSHTSGKVASHECATPPLT